MKNVVLLLALTALVCLAVSPGIPNAEAANSLAVAQRVGQAGETALVFPITGEWTSPLLGYTISMRFDPAFVQVTDVNLTGTGAAGAQHFIPQWDNEAGYVTAEVVMGTQYPQDFSLSIPPGSGGLLNIVVTVNGNAPPGEDMALDLADGEGIPPRDNRFFWNDGTVITPSLTDGLLQTVFVMCLDLEADDGGFDPGDSEWEWGTDPWVPANKLWGTGLEGNYQPEACDALLRQFDLPDGYGSGYLTFSHKYSISNGKSYAYDGANIQALVPPSTWVVLRPEWSPYNVDSLYNHCLTYQPGYTGASSGWPTAMIKAGVNLSGYIVPAAGGDPMTCDLRWMFGSDEWPTVDRGWFIDDVCVYAAPTGAGLFFIRGDINNDGHVDISDIVYLINYIFRGGPPPPAPCDRADVNDDGLVDISDSVYLVNFVYQGGPQPPWPYPTVGIDPTPDNLPTDCGGKGGEVEIELSGGREPMPSNGNATEAAIPDRFSLGQNSPNPFEATTEIRYDLPRACHVRLDVYNSLGQKVATILDADQAPGRRSVSWDARSVAGGLYFYRLQAGEFSDQRKMILLR